VIAIGYIKARKLFERPGPVKGKDAKAALRFLKEYFKKGKNRFRVRLDYTGITPFERTVYRAMLEIPSGEVLTYSQVARKIKKPGASRAVGNALHRNPFLIYVPCHRVVRKDGDLGGFGPGLWMKKWLLTFEAKRKGHRA
jgi:methylated-DNA-[protein]-cysteine S-methyltransferase